MDTSSPAPEPAIEWPQHVGPYHLSLAQWLRWASDQLKDLSAKVQMLEINYSFCALQASQALQSFFVAQHQSASRRALLRLISSIVTNR